MTDQSRVEAVARALCAEEGRDPDVWYLADASHRQWWCLFKSRAQAAIEANDAWLKEQAPVLKPCPSCEEPCSIEEMECPKCGLALW